MSDRKFWVFLLGACLLFACAVLPQAALAQEEEEEELQPKGGDRPNPMELLTRSWGKDFSIPGFGRMTDKAKARLAAGKSVVMRVRNDRALRRFGMEAKVGERMRLSSVNGRLRIAPLAKGAKGIVLANGAKQGIILHRTFLTGTANKAAIRKVKGAPQGANLKMMH